MFLRKVGMTLTGLLPAVILVLIFLQGVVYEPEEIGRPGLHFGRYGHDGCPAAARGAAREFLSLIVDADPLPSAVCFYTDGVKLGLRRVAGPG